MGSERCHRVAQPSLARPPRRRGFSSEGWAESLARARAFATFLHFLFHRPPKGGKNVDRDEEVEVKLGGPRGKSGEGEGKWLEVG